MQINRKSFTHGSQKTYNTELITSLTEFVSYVDYIRKLWNDVYPWFRGVAKAKYPLIPGIYRSGDWQFDWGSAREITDEFIRRAAAPNPNSPRNLTRWEWYHVMQHHGLPTRLLDWTTGSLIALYFALRDLPGISRPAVWVLDPYWLNGVTTGHYVAFYTDQMIQSDTDKDVLNSYLDHHADESDAPDLPRFPIAVQPPNVTPRINAQKGCFTVHGWMHDGLGALSKQSTSAHLIQLRISDSKAEQLKDDLKTAGISEATLFPDLDGLAREIRVEYGFREAFRKWS